MISVIMATYNGSKYIEEAINSVLNQSYNEYEFIIVDDGSTDSKVAEICKKYDRIIYVRQENKGPSAARNNAISISKGEYICFIDDDDVWSNDKLEKQISYFEKNNNKNIGIVSTWFEMIDKDGNLLCKIGNELSGKINRLIILNGNIINPPSSVMVKKEALDKVGVFDENLRGAEDTDLWYRISLLYEIHSINEFLIKYRIHENNASRNVAKMEMYEKAFLNKVFESNSDEQLKFEAYLNHLNRMLDAYFSISDIKKCREKIKEIFKLDKTKIKEKRFLKYCILSLLGENTILKLKDIKKKAKNDKNIDVKIAKYEQ